MGSIIVQFPGIREVGVDSVVKGETKSLIELEPGRYVINLGGEEDYIPEQQDPLRSDG